MTFDKKSMNPTWFFSPNPELSISVRTILTQTLVSSPKSESGCRSSLQLASLVCHLTHFRPTLFTYSLTTTHWEASPPHLTPPHQTSPSSLSQIPSLAAISPHLSFTSPPHLAPSSSNNQSCPMNSHRVPIVHRKRFASSNQSIKWHQFRSLL